MICNRFGFLIKEVDMSQTLAKNWNEYTKSTNMIHKEFCIYLDCECLHNILNNAIPNFKFTHRTRDKCLLRISIEP